LSKQFPFGVRCFGQDEGPLARANTRIAWGRWALVARCLATTLAGNRATYACCLWWRLSAWDSFRTHNCPLESSPLHQCGVAASGPQGRFAPWRTVAFGHPWPPLAATPRGGQVGTEGWSFSRTKGWMLDAELIRHRHGT